ncbi:aminodeoxychorismate synthase component I [Aquimarina intermedia]|uniref:aminodeoxychorismate synthase component I n=1 Tax=Aquimarina intermedia TaxID=350814 RepID=UPI0011E60867|nr:aminodeoxychorismate synthase component I [Aquimarina intermedia]
MRTFKEYSIHNILEYKKKLLRWAQQFEEVTWLDSNEYPQTYTSYDAILAVDAFTVLRTDETEAFAKLSEYQQTTKDWLFGYLSYDLKNNVENLTSKNKDGLEFPELYFFQPKRLFLLKGNVVEVQYLNMVDDEMDSDFEAISQTNFSEEFTLQTHQVIIKSKITKFEYLESVKTFLNHIQRGDIYEANFCQEFYDNKAAIAPLPVYEKLNEISKAPFAAFLKFESCYALSTSPERYIKKEGDRVITQPIKGTAKRSQNIDEDLAGIAALERDQKERSENIMIVDLVRNDLSKTAVKGSVNVEELCRVYSFKQVHQMISTVTSKVERTTDPVSILRTTFPMGSMTGAPKVSALQIIEELETSKRGLYSGAIGYFTPEGDFDFNVVIRSILYNQKRNYISYTVGSAITAKSVPEKEYEECLLKAKAMRQVLEK